MKCQSLFPTERSYSNGDGTTFALKVIIFVCNIIANGGLLYAIIKLQLTRRPAFIFYSFTCLSDLLISILIQPLMAYTATLPIKSCTILDVIAQCLAHSLCEFSGIMLTLVAIDRYQLMRQKQNWHLIMNKRRAFECVLVSFFVCIIVGVLSVFSSLLSFVYEFQLVLSAINAIILLIVLFIYIRGYIHLTNSVNDLNADVGQRVAKFIAIILAIMALCYIPTFIVYPWYLYNRYKAQHADYKESAFMVVLLSPLVIINSFLSALVLINSSQELHRFFQAKIHALLCRTNQVQNES